MTPHGEALVPVCIGKLGFHTRLERESSMSEEDQVREASKRFYAALNSMLIKKNEPMANVWAHDSTVTAMQPLGGRLVGWEEVRDSFAQVGEISGGGEISVRDQIFRVVGDMAYELGTERTQAQRPMEVGPPPRGCESRVGGSTQPLAERKVRRRKSCLQTTMVRTSFF
jgi:hypothetical protein